MKKEVDIKVKLYFNEESKMKIRAFIYIILAGIGWGTSGLFVNALSSYGFSAVQIIAARGVVSAIVMTLYVAIRDKKLFRVTKQELVFYFLAGLGILLTGTFYFVSMQMTSVSTAVVLMYTEPIFVMVYSVLFFGEKLNPLKIISVISMMIGCCLVSGIVGGIEFNAVGIAIGLGSGIAYSAYNIVTKIEMRKGYNPISANAYCFIFMCVLALMICNPPQMAQFVVENPFPVIPLMVGIGIIACVLPYFLYTLALRDLPVGTASSLSIVEPMAATVFSVVILGETLVTSSLIGIVLIIGSVFLLGKSELGNK